MSVEKAVEKNKRYRFNRNNLNIEIDCVSQTFVDIELVSGVKYLKGIFTNKGRFNSRFIKPLLELDNKVNFGIGEFIKQISKIYDEVEAFTYTEAFEIESDSFRALVFGSIDISNMINELGCTRIATDGKEVTQKVYSTTGDYLGDKTFNNIYEVHEVDGTKLGLDKPLYALKCWCTTTDKEHWLWIDDSQKMSPLEAIASTFRVHENLIPYIKEIKRQGDILLLELTEDIQPSGDVVPLTAAQYFGFLTCQS